MDVADMHEVFAELLEEHRIDDDEQCPCGCDVRTEENRALTTHELRVAHYAEVLAGAAEDHFNTVWDHGWGNGSLWQRTNGDEGIVENPHDRRNQ